MAPNIIAVLLARVFHIGDQNHLTGLVQGIPFDASDLFLPAGREQSKRGDAHHVDFLLAPIAHFAEVPKQFVELFKCGATVPFFAAGKRLALLFASAAVLLDIFKYLAWPVAIRVLRGSTAALTIACALMLSIVSGWATYDCLMSSITISKATHDVMTTDRVQSLSTLSTITAYRIKILRRKKKKSRLASQYQ